MRSIDSSYKLARDYPKPPRPPTPEDEEPLLETEPNIARNSRYKTQVFSGKLHPFSSLFIYENILF
ncbi:hypothetical protein BB561_005364 [Smittium simulii]|uniref:Uncharacterized protein n=1 Tax=Smittium simulii TaxID=133385 RepID=A0A2T9YAR7_9FUNG|nr:hypothetical protein BB561_005364 [Smittium simulii]